MASLKNITKRTYLFLGILILAVLCALVIFKQKVNESTKSRAKAEEYVAAVLRCDTQAAAALRAYEKTEKSDIDLACSNSCKPFELAFVKQSGPMTKEKAYGAEIKQVTYEYKLTCGKTSVPYMISMDYDPDKQQWLVYLESAIGSSPKLD